MRRRDFLQHTLACSAAGLLGACQGSSFAPAVKVFRPGMAAGHALRDRQNMPPISGEQHCDVAILGSGAAGLSAAWKLMREGYKNLLMVEGPQPGGNTAGERLSSIPCPTAAHYLPLPSPSSWHVREMLAVIGVLHGSTHSVAPEYDEQVLVHPSHERLYQDGQWKDHLLDLADPDAQKFLQHIATLRTQTGRDRKAVFSVPISQSSQDPAYLALDQLSFYDWLAQAGYRSPQLYWYADYICRDDYGASAKEVSAYAGLHYFASRNGQARNAEPGAVLTWPDGLNGLAQALRTQAPCPRIAGFVRHVREHKKGVEITVQQGDTAFLLHAQRAICALPLHVASHIVASIKDYGFNREHLAPQASWMVSNVLLRAFPEEPEKHPLAWDNVLYQGAGLGYVVATHQLIRAAKPQHTVFTTYHALPPSQGRKWLQTANEQDCLALALSELLTIYGPTIKPLIEAVHIHQHGHAMSIPRVGYRGNKGLQALQAADGKLLFAHSDLSGYSVFEEASWWGFQAALRILGRE